MKPSLNQTNALEKPQGLEETSSPRGIGDAITYMTRLTRLRLLTFEEEVDLANRVQHGGKPAQAAKDRLVEANMQGF